jgi:uncharacterized RDD family membrane protein YckC
VPFAKPLFAPPIKRFAASAIDIAIVTCVGWFVVNLITREWYPYGYLAIGLPLTYWLYETTCLTVLRGGSLGRRLFDIQVVSAIGTTDLAPWQSIVRPGIRVALYASLALYFSPDGAGSLDIAVLPALIETALLYSPVSLTVADIVARTRVVNAPPPQPHRAPAGPMYSATDAEFGRAPRRPKPGRRW